MKNFYAIIVAAGRGRRFGGELPKQYCMLNDKTVLYHTVQAFLRHPEVKGVRVIIHPDDQDLYKVALEGVELLSPVFGGASRQESVCKGLESLQALAVDGVLIHDAARPFVDQGVISRVIEGIKPQHGIIPALPVADTLKRAVNGLSGDTVDRTDLWRAQTPQGFLYDDILEAHQKTVGAELTDDAAAMEAVGKRVGFVLGHEDNFKITTQDDYKRARKMMEKEMETRVGSGFDVHRFEAGDHVYLCGVRIAHTQKLKGHSDADVALHALTDALLGAIGAGDIGTHFPPSEPQWKGVASYIFLRKACDLIAEKGGSVVNVDLTIMCERPKIGPHRIEMCQAIADIMQIDVSRVSVKGTTTEKLGFTGRGEGIAAQAVCSVKIPE